jgi:hypothetical protein
VTAVLDAPVVPAASRVPSPETVLGVLRDILDLQAAGFGRRSAVLTVAGRYRLPRQVAAKAVRDAVKAFPDDPAAVEWGWLFRVAQVRIGGAPLTRDDIDGGAVDTAVDADYRSRGEHQ